MTSESAKGSFFLLLEETGIVVVRHPSGMPSKQEFDRRVIESSTTQVSTSLLSVFATHKSTKEKGKTIFGVTLIFHEYTLCTHLAKCTL